MKINPTNDSTKMIKPHFIVRYAGGGVKFTGREIELVDDMHATSFPRASAARDAAHRAGINYQFLAVADLAAETAAARANN